MNILLGAAILAAGAALLYAFVPAPGQTAQRPEWIEMSVAITATFAFGVGAMLAIVGVASFFL